MTGDVGGLGHHGRPRDVHLLELADDPEFTMEFSRYSKVPESISEDLKKEYAEKAKGGK